MPYFSTLYFVSEYHFFTKYICFLHRVIAVGVTAGVDITEITNIASTPQDVIMVDDFLTLSSSLDNLVQTACEVVTTTPASTTTPAPPISEYLYYIPYTIFVS